MFTIRRKDSNTTKNGRKIKTFAITWKVALTDCHIRAV
jgi:hypothetical protein